MMGEISHHVYEFFKKMGLASVDAKVYVTLLAQGPLTVPKLSQILGMHRPQVFEAVKRLESRGMVISRGGKPAYYMAVEPEIVIKKFNEELRELEKQTLTYLKSLQTKTLESVFGVWLIKDFRVFLRKAEQIINSSKIDIAVCGSMSFIKKLLPNIKNAEEKGVMVYMIVYEVPEEKIELDQLKDLRKVKLAISGDLMVVGDSKSGVLAQRRTWPHKVPRYGLYIEEPALIDYMLHDFFYRWLRGKIIRDEKITLPARFTMHRLALLEAERLVKEGLRMKVKVEGYWVKKGVKDVVEGVLEDIVIDLSTGLMHFKVRTGSRVIRVGGPDAIVEDFASNVITLEVLE